MDTDLKYAIIKAAYAAWESGIAQGVEGTSIIVIPDTQLAEVNDFLAARGMQLEEGVSLPKLWIEHEGRRAAVEWLIQPPITRPQEQI